MVAKETSDIRTLRTEKPGAGAISLVNNQLLRMGGSKSPQGNVRKIQCWMPGAAWLRTQRRKQNQNSPQGTNLCAIPSDLARK